LATVAGYMIEHPDEVTFGTIRSIADRCSVSSTSVFRLALNLGFHGFADMRELFRRPLRSSTTSR
jgi:DNA-binding MurR/RpiR family transcriptional regulator